MSGVDIVAFQETHLTVKQEQAFNVYAQSFDKFYVNGMSQSGGIMVAVRRSSNMHPKIVSQDLGHKLVLDLTLQGETI